MNNKAQEAYFKAHPHTIEDVDNFCREANHRARFLRVDCTEKDITYSVSQKVVKNKDGHVETVKDYLNDIFHIWRFLIPQGSFIVFLEDGLQKWAEPYVKNLSVMSFGREKGFLRAFLIPDPAFMEGYGYKSFLGTINENNEFRPWKKRKEILYWRGAASGRELERDTWMDSPRAKLCLMSKNSILDIDASFTEIPFTAESGLRSRFYDSDLVSDRVSFTEFSKYRYQIDIEGYSCPWQSTFLKLAMESVLLKVKGNQEQWYYNKLIPWKHYIPIERDLSDLPEALEWVKYNNRLAWEIMKDGQSFIKLVGFDTTRHFMKDIIRAITVT